MLKRTPYCGSCTESKREFVQASSATESESIPHALTTRAPPLTKFETASESPELAVSVSANVPPVVLALDAVLRTSA
jgi:hypothetical protein